MRRQVIVAAAVVLLLAGCSFVSDEQWHWCQGHIEAVLNAYSSHTTGAPYVDWFFRQGDDRTRSNGDTVDACKAA